MSFILSDAADVRLAGAAILMDIFQVSPTIGAVTWKPLGSTIISTFTPFAATSSSIVPGAPFTPSMPAGATFVDELACALDGKIILIQSWGTTLVLHNRILVLDVNSGSISVDSDNTDLVPGSVFSSIIARIDSQSVLVTFKTHAGVTTTYRLDVGAGTVSATDLTGSHVASYGFDQWYYVKPGVGAYWDGSNFVTVDPSGSVIATLALPMPGGAGALKTIRVDDNTVVLVTQFVAQSAWLIEIDPLTLVRSSVPFAFQTSISVNLDYAQLVHSGMAGQFFDVYLSFPGAFPPDNADWAAAGFEPAVFGFNYDPNLGGDGAGGAVGYIAGPLGHFLQIGYLPAFSGVPGSSNQRYWTLGVGTDTVLLAYAWNNGAGQFVNLAVWHVLEDHGPVCDVTVSPDTGHEPLLVTSDATASRSHLPPTLLTTTVDWGDGAVTFNGLIQTHTYNPPTVPRTFDVVVTVTDWFGAHCETPATVRVTPTVEPPQRTYPREDGLGISAARSVPLPTSLQAGTRSGPVNWYR